MPPASKAMSSHCMTERAQPEQMIDILQLKLVKRSVDIVVAPDCQGGNRQQPRGARRQTIRQDRYRYRAQDRHDIKGAKDQGPGADPGRAGGSPARAATTCAERVIAMLRKADFYRR